MKLSQSLLITGSHENCRHRDVMKFPINLKFQGLFTSVELPFSFNVQVEQNLIVVVCDFECNIAG